MGDVTELPGRAIKNLGLSPEVERKLIDIQAEVASAYREHFIEMVQTMKEQASALDRIQETLRVLIRAVAPQVAGQVPPAVRVVGDGERPDLASAVIVADPIGQGFALSQANLAKALGVNSADVSILSKSFKLDKEADCAVVVRSGPRNTIVNYHPRAIDRFRELVRNPPHELDPTAKAAVARVRKKLGMGKTPSSPPDKKNP